MILENVCRENVYVKECVCVCVCKSVINYLEVYLH